jgi:hypothetical protein
MIMYHRTFAVDLFTLMKNYCILSWNVKLNLIRSNYIYPYISDSLSGENRDVGGGWGVTFQQHLLLKKRKLASKAE